MKSHNKDTGGILLAERLSASGASQIFVCGGGFGGTEPATTHKGNRAA